MTTTPTTASVYQQLRGHLTELKLADAADLNRPGFSAATLWVRALG